MIKLKENLFLILTLLFISFGIVYSFVRYEYRNKKLQKVQQGIAIFEKFSKRTVGDDAWGYFRYEIKQKTYRFKQSGDFSMLSVGDTVEIEYSIEDNSVARVINKHYMYKYKW